MGVDAGAGSDGNTSNRVVHPPIALRTGCLWGEQQSAGKHHLALMTNEVQARFKKLREPWLGIKLAETLTYRLLLGGDTAHCSRV